jgi:hypothetical protein
MSRWIFETVTHGLFSSLRFLIWILIWNFIWKCLKGTQCALCQIMKNLEKEILSKNICKTLIMEFFMVKIDVIFGSPYHF